MNDTVHISAATSVLFLCRLCGTEIISPDIVVNIFDANGLALDIKSKIANCLDLIVNQNDILPKILCTECVDNLEKFNEFKIKSNDTALYLINLLTKQISVGGNKPLIQTKNNQDNNWNSSDCEVHIEEEPEQLSYSSSNFVQIPPLQMSNDLNPSFNESGMHFENVISNINCKKNFPVNSQSIVHVNSVPKPNNNKVKSKSSAPKCKTEPIRLRYYSEYKCAHCPYVRSTKRKILQHINYHLDTLKNYNCSVCGMKLRTKASLSAHMKLHNKQYSYICNYCGKGFSGKTSFEVHVRSAHTKDYPFHCTKCDKKFASKQGLKLHEEIIHNDEYNFTCEICNESFKSKHCLTYHKKKHLPKQIRQKFKCNLCDARFIKSCSLKNHTLVHTGELKYKCDMCDKRYRSKPSLQIHILTHTGEKSHVCDVCGKAFALNCTLVNHRRIHTGERPFECNVCQKSFNQRSALGRHKKSCSQTK